MQRVSPSRAMPRGSRNRAAMLLLLGAATALGGCAKDRTTTGSLSRGQQASVEQMTSQQLGGAINQLGAAYEKDPANIQNSIAYATALRSDGRNDQALAVMKKLVITHPSDRSVLAAFGKALASAGQFEQALDAVRRAQTPEQPDWRLLSAEGAILDQLGQAADAREQYRRALDIVPNEPSVISNLGMSYLLEGDLKAAETYLRSALEKPGADNTTRQNLALAVGLQGRFDEAEQIASQALSPEEAQANIAYLRSIIAQQNTWAQLEKEGKNKPKS
jgi:Flp pilus assembly protein TadD